MEVSGINESYYFHIIYRDGQANVATMIADDLREGYGKWMWNLWAKVIRLVGGSYKADNYALQGWLEGVVKLVSHCYRISAFLLNNNWTLK